MRHLPAFQFRQVSDALGISEAPRCSVGHEVIASSVDSSVFSRVDMSGSGSSVRVQSLVTSERLRHSSQRVPMPAKQMEYSDGFTLDQSRLLVMNA